MKLAKVIAISVLSGASIAFAAAQMATLKGTSQFTAKVTGDNGDGLEIVKTETRFFEQRIFGMEKSTERVFKVITQTSSNTLTDGATSKSYIEAYDSVRGPLDTKLWTLKAYGGDFTIYNDDFVEVTEGGCCDSPDINHYINSASGKQIAVGLRNTIADFSVPNSKLPLRYLAMIEDKQAPLKLGTKTYIATIGYFNATQVLQRARIYAQVGKYGSDLYTLDVVKNAKDENRENHVTLWSADKVDDAKVAFSGIGMSGSVLLDTGDIKFSVMVQQDGFSQALSNIPSPLELVIVK